MDMTTHTVNNIPTVPTVPLFDTIASLFKYLVLFIMGGLVSALFLLFASRLLLIVFILFVFLSSK